MPLQRACGAENQVRNKSSNGPLRVQSNAMAQSILQRVGIRQLPGICWYPAKCTEESVNQGGTADRVYSPLTDFILSRVFCCADTAGNFIRNRQYRCSKTQKGRI